MSVIPSDIVIYGSANMPEADAALAGGAVDFSKLVTFFDLSVSGTINAVSSSASDTAVKLQVKARNVSGSVVTSTVATLSGTTPITNVGTLGTVERLLAAVITGGSVAGLANPLGTAAVGDVAVYRSTAVIADHTAQAGSANASGTTPALFKLQSGDGGGVAIGQIIRIKTGTGANQLRQIVATTGYGTDVVAVNRNWGTVPDATSTYDILEGMLFPLAPNAVKAVTRWFATAAADNAGGSTRTFYEKVFVVNNNTATDLTGATIQIASETPSIPSGAALDIALCKALNDTATITNRQTLPANGDASALSFVVQPSAVGVIAGVGSLPQGAAPNAAGAQGVWLRLTLQAGTASYKGRATPRVMGSTV